MVVFLSGSAYNRRVRLQEGESSMTKHREDEYEFPCALIRGNEKTLLSKADMVKVRQFCMADIYKVTEISFAW